MLNVKDIKKEPEKFIKSLEDRGMESNRAKYLIDVVLTQEKKRIEVTNEVEGFRKTLNEISKEIGQKKKNGEDTKILEEDVKNIKVKEKVFTQELKVAETTLNQFLMEIPNLLEESVPLGKDDTENKTIKTVGDIKEFNFKVKDHVKLGEDLGLLNFNKASQLSGSRFVIYKNAFAKMERALINFFLDQLEEKGFDEYLPPYIVNREILEGTGQLPKFEEDLYQVADNQFLIPTAEVPLTNIKREEIIKEELPLKYSAYTPCFRKEAGSYGKDTKGLIRLHQFNKVEMVCITKDDESEKIHQEMVSISENLLEQLKLPYRTQLLCSGDTGFGAKKCYDIEVWVPSQNTYREISSISNCGDFQARRAGIKYKENKKNKFAHTLNGSALAVGRTMVAIIENYQNEDGSITVPEVLVPYMKGLTLIK